MQMDFEKLRKACRFFGRRHDADRNVVEVCRSPRRQDPGERFAACEERHCPFLRACVRKLTQNAKQ